MMEFQAEHGPETCILIVSIQSCLHWPLVNWNGARALKYFNTYLNYVAVLKGIVSLNAAIDCLSDIPTHSVILYL